MALEERVGHHILQLAAELRGLTEVNAITTALREAALLEFTEEQIEHFKMRLLAYIPDYP